MKSTKLAILFACCLVSSALGESDIPTIVTDGLNAYQKSGGEAALAAWLKGSPMENDTTTKINMTGLLSQIATAYGKMVGFDSIRTITVSPSLQRVYILIKFDKGPLYASFDCYKTQTGWVIPIMDCNTKANLVLPPRLLDGSNQ